MAAKSKKNKSHKRKPVDWDAPLYLTAKGVRAVENFRLRERIKHLEDMERQWRYNAAHKGNTEWFSTNLFRCADQVAAEIKRLKKGGGK